MNKRSSKTNYNSHASSTSPPSPAVQPFNEEDFNIKPTSVFFGELVGKGNFSKVFKGLYMGEVVAIKKQEITDAELEKYLLNELSILRHCKHPNIVQFVGASRVPDKNLIYSVTEYIAGGDFRMLLQSKINPSFKHRVEILKSVADALLYLHQQNIIHRDIKTDNIMLNLSLQPKLIDLGFARVVDPFDGEYRAMTCLGTDEFMAPEVTFSQPYHLPADVYSFGITVFEACCIKIPERKAQNGFCLDWDESNKMLKEKNAPDSLTMLIQSTAADEPMNRIDMQGVFEWLEELFNEMKSAPDQKIVLSEDDILKTVKDKWERILKYGEEDPANTLSLDPNDLETGFLVPDLPSTQLNEDMKLRRMSVNRAMARQTQLYDFAAASERKISNVNGNIEKGASFEMSGLDENIRAGKKPSKFSNLKPERIEIEMDSKSGTESEFEDDEISHRGHEHDPNSGKVKLADLKSVTSNKSGRSNFSSLFFRRKGDNRMSGGSDEDLMTSTRKRMLESLGSAGKSMRALGKNIGNNLNNMNVSFSTRAAKKAKKASQKKSNNKKSGGKAGFIMKKNANYGFRQWIKEWMLLTNEGLIYFKNEQGQRQADVKGALLFMDMTAKIETREPAINFSIAQAGKPNCFMILTNEKKKIFQANNKEERDDWVRRINRGYQVWHKDMMMKKLNY